MKMSTQLTLFFIAFNAFGGILIASGVAGQLGINAETGSPDQIEQLSASDEEIALGNQVGGTLFGMYNQLTKQVGSIFYAVAPGFAMLKNFLPDLWVDYLLSPMASVIVAKDLIAFARGTDL